MDSGSSEKNEKAPVAIERREEVLIRWAKLRSEEKKLERDIKKVRTDLRKIEKEHPFIGTIRGMIKKKEVPSGSEKMDQDGPPSLKRKRTDHSEEQRAVYRKFSALLNKIKQIKRNGKKPSETDVKGLAVAAVGAGQIIPDEVLRGLVLDDLGEAVAEGGYPIDLSNL